MAGSKLTCPGFVVAGKSDSLKAEGAAGGNVRAQLGRSPVGSGVWRLRHVTFDHSVDTSGCWNLLKFVLGYFPPIWNSSSFLGWQELSSSGKWWAKIWGVLSSERECFLGKTIILCFWVESILTPRRGLSYSCPFCVSVSFLLPPLCLSVQSPRSLLS